MPVPADAVADRRWDHVVPQLIAVRRCPACNRDIDRDPWPYGFPCGHCDDWTLEQAKQAVHGDPAESGREYTLLSGEQETG